MIWCKREQELKLEQELALEQELVPALVPAPVLSS